MPVVKFSQSFTQRNALRGAKPVYGTANVEPPQEGDIVSLRQTRSTGRAHGWTISITSSSPTEDEIQVEVQSHGQTPPLPTTTTKEGQRPIPMQIQMQGEGHRAPSHATRDQRSRRTEIRTTSRIEPKFPSSLITVVPTLARDRVMITKDDLSGIRVKAISLLALGLCFPPLWLIMGWGHALDTFILPSTGIKASRDQVVECYKPYRTVASVLAGIVVLGTFVGIIVGALALAGTIA